MTLKSLSKAPSEKSPFAMVSEITTRHPFDAETAVGGRATSAGDSRLEHGKTAPRTPDCKSIQSAANIYTSWDSSRKSRLGSNLGPPEEQGSINLASR